MPPPYYAHSGTLDDCSDWQLLAHHLRQVAALAESFARTACPADMALTAAARAAGLLHDLGKYRDEFQEYIRGRRHKGDPLTFHKQAGAAKSASAKNVPAAFAIAGHHGGMPDRVDLELVTKPESCPSGAPVADAVWPVAERDCPDLVKLVLAAPPLRDAFHGELFTRVLFSCLVDADWTDTGEHQRRVKGLAAEPSPPPLAPEDRLKNVLALIAERASDCVEPQVKQARAEVLAACLGAADRPPGLYSLTVPTGGGKTLAGLAFALKHATRHTQPDGSSHFRRVIYVAPYMTILEQNADVFRAALGVGRDDPTVFEHYSLAEPAGGDSADETDLEAAARRAENWDAPVIVTTNVQFFESLFSNKPGRCRKLHNIARSVIILDECQSLPPGLAAPTCRMLKQLASDLGCTVVLCTATQPAFDHDTLKNDERLRADEIVPEQLRQRDERNLFTRLKRVQVEWPKEGEVLDWSDVARAMRAERSALCVVNTKKAARAVHEELVQAGADGVYHLSTGMCPQHRREKLAEIKQQLNAKRECYVVSTQLIEAGVDIDFPFLLRELAPLESIVQAAGRCNREGRLKDESGHLQLGRVVVFRSVDGKMPPDRWYNAGRSTLETSFLARGIEPQIDDPSAIRDYYRRLFYSGGPQGLDGYGIRAKRVKFRFKTITYGEEPDGRNAYRIINDPGEPAVVASWAAHQVEIESLLSELANRPRKALYRKLAPFQVNLLPSQCLKSDRLIERRADRLLVWRGKYNAATGIVDELLDDVLIA